jgi:hypothetical protein
MSSLRSVDQLYAAGASVGASATNQAITKSFAVSDQDSRTISIDIKYSTATVATGITAKLQSSFDNGTTWIDSATVAITAGSNTYKSIVLDIAKAADQTYLPLRPLARVVVSSGAGDSATITSVMVSRRTGA